MAIRRRRKPSCPNCKTTFPDAHTNYCPNCGQENQDYNVPFKYLILDLLGSLWNFDTKFIRTFTAIFIPGKLTADYLSGKRARYVPPARLYLFISLIFFILLAYTTDEKENQEMMIKDIKTLKLGPTDSASVTENDRSQLDSLLITNDGETSAIDRFIARNIAKLVNVKKGEFQAKVTSVASYMMFILMPYFAFLMWLLYIRANKNYYEHLIFSIHLHCVTGLILIIYMALTYFIPLESLDNLFLLMILLYAFFSLKNIFKKSWGNTLLKIFLLTAIYGASLILFLLLTIVTSTVTL